MKLKEIEIIMDEKHKQNKEEPSGCWAEEEACPYGIIRTKEQYDYIKYYSDNTSIDFNLKDYEPSVGKYVGLGSYFGGAVFYFYATDNFHYFNKDDLEFSYGKYGRVEF